MRKLVDDTRLIFKCCALYYQDNIGQKDICDILGISRPTVSRMLSLGKELGIVKIEIHNPDNLEYGQMERELEKIFNLQEVIIAPSIMDLGNTALKFMARILHNGDYIGISMGSTLQSIARADYFIENQISCNFVPIIGGVGESRIDIHSNYIVQEFAERFGGDCVQLFSPALFSKRELLEAFLKESTIHKIIKLFKKLDVVIMGIGVPTTEHSTVLQRGYINKNTLENFAERGAVGDVVLRYFDIHGDTEPFAEFNNRVAGLRLEQLKKIRCRVGIAGGDYKTKAVMGAIAGNFINVLITDIDCAKGLFKLKK